MTIPPGGSNDLTRWLPTWKPDKVGEFYVGQEKVREIRKSGNFKRTGG